jgi:hypothetical protein
MKPLIYLRTNQPKTDGSCSVYMRITVKGDKNYYSLKVTVLPICWDSDKYKVSRKEIKHEAYNKIIAKHLNKAENIIFRYTISDKDIIIIGI